MSIDERPDVVGRRNRIGDWEGDTVIGKGLKGALLTLVERKTLYTVIRWLTGKRANLLAKEAIKAMAKMKEKVKTITCDNGLEFSAHESITGVWNQTFTLLILMLHGSEVLTRTRTV